MKKFILLVALAVSTVAIAQKPTKGSFAPLKGETEFNIVFDYENIQVDKFKTEEAFLKDKMDKRQEKGTAEDFKAMWFADRAGKYQPKFIECFNAANARKGISVQNDHSKAKYTVHVKTTWIYPGYNIGVQRQPAKLKAIITIYETANPKNVIVSVPFNKVVGSGSMGFDYNEGSRIADAYCILARQFSKSLNKGIK